MRPPKNNLTLAERIHVIIEGTDTRAGKFFDIVLLVAIGCSVLIVMLDSVLYLRLQYGQLFVVAEWFFTVLFTIEYALRLYSAPNRKGYVFSFFGVVDLLALLPSYLSWFFVGTQYLLVVRILRI
ncbi:MAG: ion transporter, partial [Moraxella sp.]|nr:ion transporter [Moraxella sp.]